MQRRPALFLVLLAAGLGACAGHVHGTGSPDGGNPSDGGLPDGGGPQGTIYFLSPGGSDLSSGRTARAPWLTFAHALPQLNPGDTLLLLDGTYDVSNSGVLVADCTDTLAWAPHTKSGLPGAPITIASLRPRHALISGSGHTPVLLYHCSYWTLEGLHARSDDAVNDGGTYGDVVDIEYSDHILVHRCLGEYNNRVYNTQVFTFTASTDSSVVECEAYNYHRHGFDALETTSQRIAFQRNYANARPGGPCLAKGTSEDGGVHCAFDLTCDATGLCGGIPGTECSCIPPQPDGGPPDSGSCLPAWQRAYYPRCGWPSHNTEFGDEGITQYWTYNGFIENNVTLNGEGQQATGVGTVIAGGVSLFEEKGVHLGRNSSFAQNGDFEQNNLAHDMVIVGPAADGTAQLGALLCGNNDQLQNLTLVHSGYAFYAIGHDAGWCQPYWTPDASVSFSLSDTLIMDPTVYGALSIGVQDSHDVQSVDVWSPDVLTSVLFSPKLDGGFWGNAFSAAVAGGGAYDPTTGRGNLLYVPAGSSLKGAGLNGADIGANVTCLYDHGVLTQDPMWNQVDGRFVGCDWYDAGSPDDIAASEGYLQHCSTVHTLVNVGVNGGSIPACPAP